MIKTAVFVDGRFFLTKLSSILYSQESPLEDANVDRIAEIIFTYCLFHTEEKNTTGYLYRIFFYDCVPLEGVIENPVTKRQEKLEQTKSYILTTNLHKALKKKRKTALRLGHLKSSGWVITPQTTKDLLNGKVKLEDLQEKDVKLSIRQKEIDVKIGVDIASVSLKKQADKIILIAGDSDFVPAAKLARREGVDFILDSMGQQVTESLHEHIDGMQTFTNKLKKMQP